MAPSRTTLPGGGASILTYPLYVGHSFYLPLANSSQGGVSIVAIILLLDAPPPLGSEGYDRSFKTMLWCTAVLDWIGAILSLGAVTSLVLGLQWGGNEKAWRSAEVIAVRIPRHAAFVEGLLIDLH